jgi:Fe-S-cluster containining protein
MLAERPGPATQAEPAEPAARRANPCADCGACCRSYVVPVYGYDVWLISRRERLSPQDFLIACAQSKPAGDGFRLDADGPAYGLALDKRGRVHPKQPCIFLLRLADGSERCGIYAHRPVVCQAYPMALWSGVVFQRREALCPPDSWSLAEVVRPSWRSALQRVRMHFDVYQEVVACWNARVAAAPPARRLAPARYYDFLLNVYDALAAVDERFGAAGMAAVQASWPNHPRSEEALAAAARAAGAADEPPWLAYLGEARPVIDRFLPRQRSQASRLTQPALADQPPRRAAALVTAEGG